MLGDRDQLVQLISNLIDNAIKYGGEGGRVEIACERVASAPVAAGPLAGRPAVRIVVADHGPGIAREHLPRLTERFFRVETARSRQLGGTGLGLAIVKHILRRHRGHLALESELGRGTTATVYLPVANFRRAAIVIKTSHSGHISRIERGHRPRQNHVSHGGITHATCNCDRDRLCRRGGHSRLGRPGRRQDQIQIVGSSTVFPFTTPSPSASPRTTGAVARWSNSPAPAAACRSSAKASATNSPTSPAPRAP